MSRYKTVKFVKTRIWLKVCKVCGVEYQAEAGSREAVSGKCYVHRAKKRGPRLTPEEVKARHKIVALAGYHKNKHKHKGRKHRRTKNL